MNISTLIALVIVALLSSFITVWLERRKEIKLKLQDRKSLWLNEHWESISISIMNLTAFSILIIDRPVYQDPLLDLYTGLVKYSHMVLESGTVSG